MKILHSYTLSQTFTRWAMLLFLGLFLMHVGDFIGLSGDYVEAVTAGRVSDVLAYLSLRFPIFLAAWLPISVAAAGLLTAWPMMRQGTLVALCAAGIPVRRVFSSLIALALGVGVLGFLLHDQIIPRLAPEVTYAQKRMVGKLKLNQSVGRKLAWHDGGMFWCVNGGIPEEGDFRNIAVFGETGARHRGILMMADSLTWRDNTWWVGNPVVIRDYQSPVVLKKSCPLAEVGLTMSLNLQDLIERVQLDRFRTSDELFAVKSENALGYLLLRVSFGLLPLLCLIFAMPSFVRLEGRNNLGLAVGRSLLWIVVPLLGYWVLSRILISNSTYLLSGTTVVLGGLLSVGLWRWWTMRV